MPATAKPKAPAKPTEKEIEEYLQLEAERKELDQKSRAIARRTKALADHFKSHLEAKSKIQLKVADYQILLIEGSAAVKWKDEFIRAQGPLAAEELQRLAPKTKKVQVQKAA